MKLFPHLLVPGVRLQNFILNCYQTHGYYRENEGKGAVGRKRSKGEKGGWRERMGTVGEGDGRRMCGDRREEGEEEGEIKKEFTA